MHHPGCNQRIQIRSWPIMVAIVGLLLPASGLRAEDPTEPKPMPSIEEEEESVLVAERQALSDPKEASASIEQLQPIAQVSDYAPDLAESMAVVEDSKSQSKGKPAASSNGLSDKRTGLTAVANSLQSVSTRFLVSPSSEEPAEVPAEFSGIQPGVSTVEDVVGRWGDPLRNRRTDGGLILSFRVEPFPVVDVLVQDDVVEAIKVEPPKSTDARKLAKHLHLEKIDSVDINDEEGETIGIAFPERGVVFMLKASGAVDSDSPRQLVSYMILERLDPEAFVLRVEGHLHGPYEKNVADLKHAIALDGDYAHAYWLLAKVYLATGKPTLAEDAVSEALELDPDNDAYRMCHVQCLEAQGEYDDAVYETRAVLDKKNVAPLVKAEAFHRLGCLASFGDPSISSKAVAFQNDAIAIADKLAASRNMQQRREAKELLVDAHLAVAREIAKQEFRNKSKAIAEWMGRASGLAEDCIANDEGSLLLRLRVARQGLAAISELRPTKDPHPWVLECEETEDELKAQWDDERWQERLAWEMGQVYYHALSIEHVRRQTPSAVRFGKLAIDNLAVGARSRQAVPPSEELVGNLYFHVGVVHAVHNEDHAKAIAWYDKAAPLLMAAKPESELVVPRREGETLVSMGVSYWQQGKAARALDLTQAGAKLIEKSIEGHVTDKDSLSIPYTNLATMYKELGNDDEALKYSRWAKSSDETLIPKPRTEAAQPERTAIPRATDRTANSRTRTKASAEPRSSAPRSDFSPASNRRLNRSTSQSSGRGVQQQSAQSSTRQEARRKLYAEDDAPSPLELEDPNFRPSRPLTPVSATFAR